MKQQKEKRCRMRLLRQILKHKPSQPKEKAPLKASGQKKPPIPEKPKGPGKAPQPRAGSHAYWLIDLENTGRTWTRIIDRLSPGDTVAVFWSGQASKWTVDYGTLSQIPDAGFVFLECETGKPNAMDFQLAAWLGRMSALDPGARFVVVSGDQGYRPLRGFLGRLGVPVAFFDPKAESPEKPPAPAAVPKEPAPRAEPRPVPSVEEVRRALAAAGIPVKPNQAERSVAALKALSGSEPTGRARQILNETVVNAFKENWRKTAFRVLSGYLD